MSELGEEIWPEPVYIRRGYNVLRKLIPLIVDSVVTV
jgi:hypothetical protein